MSAYARLLELAQRQIDLASAGDLDAAARLLNDRQVVLNGAPKPTAEDTPVIQQVLQLDRRLASMFRERMIAIRDEALGIGRGRTALNRYRPPTGPATRLIDAAG